VEQKQADLERVELAGSPRQRNVHGKSMVVPTDEVREAVTEEAIVAVAMI
jgi:hypothetical protein